MDAWGAVQTTLQQPVQFVRSVAQAFGKQACGPATGGVTGPVGIARVTGSAANAVPQLGLGPVLYLAALISMNLAFVNLIPFPALDGGRLLFVLIGAVRRRRIRPEIEGLIHLLGMAVLLTFILIVTGHDVTQWLHGQ
jgi:regulator of sigma E protease